MTREEAVYNSVGKIWGRFLDCSLIILNREMLTHL